MAFFSKNKEFGKPFAPSNFRRLAMGAWAAPSDPTIYGVLELNIEKALVYIDQAAKQSGERITITHFVGKVLAEVLKKHPEMNCEIRFGKFYPRKSIDLAFQVGIEGKSDTKKSPHDLSSGFVGNAGEKPLAQIAKELNSVARSIRANDDPQFSKLKKISSYIPGFLLTIAVKVIQFLLNTLNIWSPAFGVPRNPFGSILITNVGSLGIDFALPALFPPANVPSIIAVGVIYLGPIYQTDEKGNVTHTRLERFVRLCGAFDHRYIDGLHASRIARDIRRHFEDPGLLGT